MEMGRIPNPLLDSCGRGKREIVDNSIVTCCDDDGVINMNGCDECVCNLVVSHAISFTHYCS